MINELLEKYWNAAYAEGLEGRNHDTEDGVAQRTLNEILEEFAAKDREIAELKELVEVMTFIIESEPKKENTRDE